MPRAKRARQIPRRGVDGGRVVVVVGVFPCDEKEEKLPGARTKATRTIQANRLARMLCERGILSMLRAMFMYRV